MAKENALDWFYSLGKKEQKQVLKEYKENQSGKKDKSKTWLIGKKMKFKDWIYVVYEEEVNDWEKDFR